MEKEINYIVLVSIKNYKIVGMEEATQPQKQTILFLNPKLKDESFLETEIFKSFFFFFLGKKEFFLEFCCLGFVVVVYGKNIKMKYIIICLPAKILMIIIGMMKFTKF